MEAACRVAAVSPPIVPAIRRLIRAHPGTLSLAQGEAGFEPPPQALEAVRTGLTGANAHAYGPAAGEPVLLEALADKLQRENGIDPAAGSRLQVTAGANLAFLYALLAIVEPGEEVVLPVPWYFNHEMAVTLADCQVVAVPVEEDGCPSVRALERAAGKRTRAIVTVSPNNPTGAVYPREALAAINKLCRDRGLYHISDETYEYFTYNGARHYSPGADPAAARHTLSLFSFSKAYGMAGWRVGCLVYPEHLAVAMSKIQDTCLICPPAPSQWAAVGALRAGSDYCRARLARLDKARILLQQALRASGRLAGSFPADGAFYLFVRLRTQVTDRDVVDRLIRRHRVAVLPGTGFGMPAGCWLRLSYGGLSPATAAEAAGRLGSGLASLPA